jgi:phosphopantetheine adenylyltransferase
MMLNNVHKKYALFIGRYQTLHKGHKFLFKKKIDEGIPVFVWIRAVFIDDKNPFTPQQVLDMFHRDPEIIAWLDSDMIQVQILPDIEGVYYGRDVGYKVEQLEVPPEIAEISATKLRDQLKQLHNGSIG